MRDQLNKGEHLSTPLKTKKHSFFQGGETKRMKTRKIMASLLAFAMLLSIVAVPVGTADAASEASVNRVPQVKDDQKFSNVSGDETPVVLRLGEKNSDFDKPEAVITLKLNNAEFLFDSNNSAANILNTINRTVSNETYIKDAEKVSNSEIRLTLVNNNKEKQVWNIPLISKMKGKGEATVTIDGRGSFVTGSTLTFAVAADGGSIASVGSVKKFSDPTIGLDTITVDETRVGSLVATDSSGNVIGQKITLRLPSNFEWILNSASANTPFEITHSSNLNVALKDSADVGKIKDGDTVEIDGNVLTITDLEVPKDNNGRGTLYFKGLTAKATSDAKFGDVTVRISGGKFTAQTLTVAEYRDYGVIVKAGDEEIPELFAGRYETDATAEEHELQTLIIEENSKNAWMTERRTRIEFPAGVKIRDVEVVDSDKFDTPSDFATQVEIGKNTVEYAGIKKSAAYTASTGDKAKVELRFYVSVAADFKGDITAKVSGNALVNDETEVVLGKAVAPVTVESDSVDLRIGVLNQPIGDIIISETTEEAILKDTAEGIVVRLGRGNDSFSWNNIPTVEVIEGDLVLDTKGIDKSGNVLTIPVKTVSSKPSKIKISGGYVDLDRTIPEGAFKVFVGGNAIVPNHFANPGTGDARHDKEFAAEIAALNVVTPAPGEERRTVKFNLDSKEYVVIEAGKEVTKTMDVAPYNENGRALLPLRFVAEALGVSEDNIVWNANTKEVTIFKGDRVAKVAIGSNKLVVNGTEVVMDTTAAIKDSRTVLPIRFVGQALGANIGWDDATRTITVQQ